MSSPSPNISERLTKAFRDKAVLIIHIDIQNAFANVNSPPESIQDVHAADMLSRNMRYLGHENIWVVYNNHTGKPIPASGYEDYLSTRPSAYPMSDIESDRFCIVRPQDPELIFSKCHDNAFTNTHLRHYVQKRTPKAMIFTGRDSDACVKSSVQCALRSRYGRAANMDVIVAFDATNVYWRYAPTPEAYRLRLNVGNDTNPDLPCRRVTTSDRLHVLTTDQILSCANSL